MTRCGQIIVNFGTDHNGGYADLDFQPEYTRESLGVFCTLVKSGIRKDHVKGVEIIEFADPHHFGVRIHFTNVQSHGWSDQLETTLSVLAQSCLDTPLTFHDAICLQAAG